MNNGTLTPKIQEILSKVWGPPLTSDLKRRLTEHNDGDSRSTKPYIPLTLEAYVAVRSKQKALALEKYLKSGSGKAILKKRILQSEASA